MVGTYDDLIAAGVKGDDITPHHIPSANRMALEGVSKGDGIAINMEQPFPGVGGRHRATFTYGTKADINMTARDALAATARIDDLDYGQICPIIPGQVSPGENLVFGLVAYRGGGPLTCRSTLTALDRCRPSQRPLSGVGSTGCSAKRVTQRGLIDAFALSLVLGRH